MFIRHETIEKNAILMLVLTLVTISFGGLFEVIPASLWKSIDPRRCINTYLPLAQCMTSLLMYHC